MIIDQLKCYCHQFCVSQ